MTSRPRIMILAISIMLPICVVRSARAEPQNEPEVWNCFGEEQHSRFQLQIRPAGPNRWAIIRTLTATDDPSKTSLIGSRSQGKIELVADTEGFVALKAELSGKPSFDADYETEYEGATLFPKKARDGIVWQYHSEHTQGGTTYTLRWTEMCSQNSNTKRTFWSALPESLPKRTLPAPSASQPLTVPEPSPQNVRSLAEAWVDQIKRGQETNQTRGTKVIATVFGYFKYEPEIDLKKGPKQLSLQFVPYVFPEGDRYAQEINDQLAKAQFSLLPDLHIAAPSIQLTPSNQSSQALRPSWPLQWDWTVTQSTLSGVGETNGTIAVEIVLGAGNPLSVSLPVKVIGKPWWWFIPWIWENILGKPEVSCTLLIFLILSMRQGFRAGMEWIWKRITNIGQGETKTQEGEPKPQKKRRRP